MSDTRSLDFEIIKEPWNKYQISDGSALKIRTILKKVDRTMKGNKPNFRIDVQPLTVIHANPELKGSPDTKPHSQEEIERTIETDDMRYDTLSQEFNEYILDDGTKIKIYTNVTGIAKTRLYHANGDPIYKVFTSNQMEIKLSTQYR